MFFAGLRRPTSAEELYFLSIWVLKYFFLTNDLIGGMVVRECDNYGMKISTNLTGSARPIEVWARFPQRSLAISCGPPFIVRGR